MIQKLRKKFVLVNMLLVSVVLLVVFGAVCFSSYHRLRRGCLDALHQAISRPMDDKPPRLELGEVKGPAQWEAEKAPVFVVELSGDGSVASVRGQNIAVDTDGMETLVNTALAQGQNFGLLHGYGLRYLVSDGRDGPGTRIAFADISGQRAAMVSLAATSLVVGLCALAAFFVISLYLAKWALRPVERAWRQQQQFVADASHELKTPLTVILANTEILLSQSAGMLPEQRKWAESSREEARRMKGLIDDLLFLARSDASKAAPVFSVFDLSDAVWSAALPFEAVAFEQGVQLCTQIDPGLQYLGHEGQIRQLAAILIDNACKYAGRGGTVLVRLYREGETATLMVQNSGAPIPKQALPRLFERFYRADSSRARASGGYGLGLAIAQAIAQAHKGKISVESGEPYGTRFTVRLYKAQQNT